MVAGGTPTEGDRCITGLTRGSARCSAFHPTDPVFEPSLHQHRSPPRGNAILRGRDKGSERALEIQSTDCRDKMRARIAASSGLFALNREISGCAGLRGGSERTRTACQPRSRYRTYIRPRSKSASVQSLNPNISAATAALLRLSGSNRISCTDGQPIWP